jgi:hypothetical protein
VVSSGEESLNFSRANTLLFVSDHLANISSPATLVYDFRRTGAQAEPFTDTVRARIVEVTEQGSKNIEVDLFTGTRRRYVAPVQEARGNPVIMVFLQHDVSHMSRQLQGPLRHFQNQIKRALAEQAQISTVEISHQGKTLPGTQITIAPYVNDPERERFETYAGKSYVFILADGIPGNVYEIRSVVPDPKNNGSLVEEVLTFRETIPSE